MRTAALRSVPSVAMQHGIAQQFAARPQFSHRAARPLITRASASSNATIDVSGISYDDLTNVKGVYLVSTQQEVAVDSLWRPDQRCVLALGRSMG